MLCDRRGNSRQSAASSGLSRRPDRAGSPGGAARRPDAGARGSRPPWPVTAPEQDQELKDTAEDQVQDRPEHEQRACPSHEPAAQQRRSGSSHSTGSPRRRTARSLGWIADALLLAVSGGSSVSGPPPSMPRPGRPTATLRRRTRTPHHSPPRTGSARFRLTSPPTRTGPARGEAAARGQRCGGSVRTRRTVPGSPRGSGHAHAGRAARPGPGSSASPYLTALLCMLSPPRVVSRSMAGLPGEVSGVALVMASPACDARGFAAVAVTAASGYRRQPVLSHRTPELSHHRHQCSFPLLAGRSRAGDARLRATARNGLSDSVSTGAGHLP